MTAKDGPRDGEAPDEALGNLGACGFSRLACPDRRMQWPRCDARGVARDGLLASGRALTASRFEKGFAHLRKSSSPPPPFTAVYNGLVLRPRFIEWKANRKGTSE